MPYMRFTSKGKKPGTERISAKAESGLTDFAPVGKSGHCYWQSIPDLHGKTNNRINPESMAFKMFMMTIKNSGNLNPNSPAYKQKETNHEYDNDERRHANLLQRLGNRAAGSIQPWLAALFGQLGSTDDVSGIKRISMHSS
jgi:hypothetical protein